MASSKWHEENKEHFKQLQRNWYEKNRDTVKAKRLAVRAEIRDLVRAAKDVPCMDCGIRYPYYVMDLDHRDPSTKVTDPAKLAAGLSVRKAKEEIAKCDPVCSNCHRIRTYTVVV